MIFSEKSIFDIEAEVIVNPVNTKGVMGSGLALQFQRKYPENFKMYKSVCDNNKLSSGSLIIWKNTKIELLKYIVNFATKDHWNNSSKLEFIESGLKYLSVFLKENVIETIVIPQIGCGLGGLNWQNDVLPMIQKTSFYNTKVTIALNEKKILKFK